MKRPNLYDILLYLSILYSDRKNRLTLWAVLSVVYITKTVVFAIEYSTDTGLFAVITFLLVREFIKALNYYKSGGFPK